MPKVKYYAVCVGRDGANIYTSWDECKEKVARYPGAKHRSFPTLKQAELWLANSLSLHHQSQRTLPSARISSPDDAQKSAPLPKPPWPTDPSLMLPEDSDEELERFEPMAQPESVAEPPSSQPPSSQPSSPQEAPPPAVEIILSPEQQSVLDRVREGRNVFFTGSAGTGKSVLLREIMKLKCGGMSHRSSKLGITAATGIAAVAISGTTLHSWAGIGLGIEPVEKLVGKIKYQPKCKPVLHRWKSVETLIIDEISMIDGTLFDKLERMARELRECALPFGGIQLVLSGDFCQLPPVSGRDEKGKTVPATFAFDAKSWETCVGCPFTLTRVYRQKDQAFVDMLNEMRFGKMSEKSIAAFTSLSRTVVYNDGIEPTSLFPTRHEVFTANTTRLKQLPGTLYTYDAYEVPGRDSNGQPVSYEHMIKLLDRLIVPKSIGLKVGAQVMLVKNLVQGVLVNGTVGQVLRFLTSKEAMAEHLSVGRPEPNASEDVLVLPSDGVWPVVSFLTGSGERREVFCVPLDFTVENAEGGMEAKREQIPLILAWALSVHKSQGQTLARVKVDLRKTFERGQAYVALSRATTMEHLQVLNFSPSKVTAHPRVLEWNEQMGQLPEAEPEEDEFDKYYDELDEATIGALSDAGY